MRIDLITLSALLAEGSAKSQATRALEAPLYMAPEQIRGDGSIGPRADLFALGHIACALVSGEADRTEDAEQTPGLFALFSHMVHAMRAGACLLGFAGGILATTLCEGHLSAAPPPPTSTAAALGRFDAGKNAFEGGKFEEALLAFQASQSLMPSPNSRLYIGRCYRALGKIASAYTNLRLASREAQDRLTATGEKRYSATRDAAASEAAELEPKVPRLNLAIPSDAPESFAVKVDGAELPKAAWGTATETDPGNHTIEATGPRLKPFAKNFELKEGEQLRIVVELKRLPTASLLLRFATRPAGLAVELDGKPIDVVDAKRETDVGEHTIVVHAPGYKDFIWKKSLVDRDDVAVGVTLAPDVAATRAKGPPKWLFFGVAGITVASVAVGTALAVKASGTANDEKSRDPLLRDPALRDQVKSTSAVANAFFIASAALGVGAGTLFFLTDWKDSEKAEPKEATMTLAPWIGPAGAGLAARGTF